MFQLLTIDDPPATLAARTTLTGAHVRLVPFAAEHGARIQQWVSSDRESFRWMLGSPLAFDDDATAFATWLAGRCDAGTNIAFTVEDLRDGSLLGYTRFLHVDLPSRTTHIGGTWYAPHARGTIVNPECKLLLLEHAFEGGRLNRVQIQTDVRNARSRRAIERIGARFEGVNRANYLGQDGRPRDTAVYAILRDEWHEVRDRLEQLIQLAGPW